MDPRPHSTPGSMTRRAFVGQALAGTAVLAGSLSARSLGEEAKKAPASGQRSATDLVTLGKSGLKTTRLGLGTGSSGGQVQRDLGQEGFTRLIRHAYDRGVRFIDTADMYKIHDMVGKAIAGLPRESLFIQSKILWEPFAPNEKQVLATLDRFRKELGVDYLDTLLIHCATKHGWPETLEATRAGLSQAREKGIIKAHGVSCHGLPALSCVAACDWVQVNLARVNHRGHHMDGASGTWSEESRQDEAAAEIEKIHRAGKGVIAMKLVGNGDFKTEDEREQSIRHVLTRPWVDAAVIGLKSPSEVDEAIERVDRALKA